MFSVVQRQNGPFEPVVQVREGSPGVNSATATYSSARAVNVLRIPANSLATAGTGPDSRTATGGLCRGHELFGGRFDVQAHGSPCRHFERRSTQGHVHDWPWTSQDRSSGPIAGVHGHYGPNSPPDRCTWRRARPFTPRRAGASDCPGVRTGMPGPGAGMAAGVDRAEGPVFRTTLEGELLTRFEQRLQPAEDLAPAAAGAARLALAPQKAAHSGAPVTSWVTVSLVTPPRTGSMS